MMKYVAIIKYSRGGITGATVKAASREEAWRKLTRAISLNGVQSIELVEVLTEEYEIV